MSKYVSFLICMVWLAGMRVGAQPVKTGVVAHIHFAGGDAVAADPNSAALKHIWASPDGLALRAQTLDKLSRAVNIWLRGQVTPGLVTPVPLRSLLDDLCRSEWQLDILEPSAGAVEFALAVRVDNARAQVWQSSLVPFLDTWKKSSPAHHAHIFRHSDWLLVDVDNSPGAVPPGSVSKLKGMWLTADVDWERLAVWFPEVRQFDFPKTQLQVAGREGNFELNGHLFLSQPLPPLQNWQFPTNTIHSPFISLTAARGISDWLKQQTWALALGLNALPDQVFTWVLPQIPFQTFAAFPLASAAAALPKIKQPLDFTLQHEPPHSPYEGYSIEATNNQLTLVGMPFVAPYIQATRDAATDYLLAGFFPNLPRGKPAPPELLARLTQPGLVFYHWEVTSERLKMFPQLYQLLFVISRQHQLDVTSAAGKWLADLGPTLGPTVTQAFEKSPDELTFTRKAPAGLTAVELVAFCSWLEAPNFPGCDLRLPPPRLHRHPKPPGVVMPGSSLH